MGQEISLHQRQDQRLILTMGLQQAFRLLQMPQLEMCQWLEAQIEMNPMLEKAESFSSPSISQNKKEYLLQNFPYTPSLFEHLYEQAKLVFSEPLEREAALFIIGNLDSKGFFTHTHEEAAAELNCSPARIKNVLEKIHFFDPPGIAVRSARESLLVQLQAAHKKKSLAYKIIERHYHELLHGKLRALEQKYKVSREKLLLLIKKEISPLDPFPGKRFAPRSHERITPDLIIKEEGETLKLIAADSNLPVFHLKEKYFEIFNRGAISAKEKQMLGSFIRSGSWLIKMVNKRKEILSQIGEQLIARQKAFLLGASKEIKPMTIKEIARELYLNPSTIARAIQNKFVLCPMGFFPLRKFFTQKILKTEGKSISNETAKTLLANIIEKEVSKRPLSDELLADKMKEIGVTLSRRTIAKYRKQLGIAPSSRRKITLRSK